MSEPTASLTALSDLIYFCWFFFPIFPFCYLHQHKNLCFCIIALQERYIISHSTYTDKTCCCLVAKSCPLVVTPWTVACQVSLSFILPWSLFKLMSIESVMPSNHLVLCHPLLFLPSIFPNFRVFSNESTLLIRWPNNWNFSFSTILPMNIQGWCSLGLTGLISLPAKGLSRIFSSTMVQKCQFFGAQPSLWSNSHIHTWLLEKP